MSLGRIGDYEILERIGAGRMGVVFRARDSGLNVLRAIKVITPEHADDPEYLRRLRHEAQTVARLQHPNIAACHHCGEAIPEPADLLGARAPGAGAKPVFFMAMEYVEGTDLDAYAGRRRLPFRQVIDIARQIASGLEVAHAAGVFHRDLKPGNIRLTTSGVVKIVDFGLAHSDTLHDIASWASTQMNSGSVLVGTPLYMAPEQARRRETSARSDLYSLGLILYELLAGRLPYSRGRPGWESDAPAAWAVDPIRRYRDDVSSRFAKILGRLLAFEPADRYLDAGQLRRDLDALGKPPVRAARWVAAAVVAVLLVGAAPDLKAWILIYLGPPARNVAVLEFESPSADPDLQRLASGLAADLFDGLRGSRGVNALGPLGRKTTPAMARDSLAAGSLLTGTLVRDGATDHLDVELLDTRNEQPRWKQDFSFGRGEWFGVRKQILAAVSGQVTREPPSQRPGPPSRDPNAAATEAYVFGLARLGDPDSLARVEAADKFERARQLDPGFALAWAGQARALWWLYDRDHDTTLLARAEDSANQALALSPGLVQARLARAKIYLSTGRTSLAIRELQDIAAANSSCEEAQRQLGYAYRKSGDLDRAEASFRRAVEISPGSRSTRRALAGFLQRAGRLSEAEEAWVWATRVGDPPWNGLAGCYVDQGRFADAVRIYEQFPDSLAYGGLLSNMATAYFYTRRMDKALVCYRRAVNQKPFDPDLRLYLGDCYTRMGRAAEAREQYWEGLGCTQKDLAVNPDDPKLHASEVLFLAKCGDRGRATQEYERHRVEPAKDSELLYIMAKSAAILGRDDDAIVLLQRAHANGMRTTLFREEDEFEHLHSNAAFRRLLRS